LIPHNDPLLLSTQLFVSSAIIVKGIFKVKVNVWPRVFLEFVT